MMDMGAMQKKQDVDEEAKSTTVKPTGKKAQTKASQKLQSAQEKALAKTLKSSLGKKGQATVDKQGGIQAAEKTGLIRRRGPRKKKDVVQQSDVPATVSSRLAR